MRDGIEDLKNYLLMQEKKTSFRTAVIAALCVVGVVALIGGIICAVRKRDCCCGFDDEFYDFEDDFEDEDEEE